MAAVRSSSSLVSNPVHDQCSDQGRSEPLIPGLPDDIAELCLHYLPSPTPTKLCFVEQSHHRLRDKLGLSSSTWCAHNGSLCSFPRGRPWSPQPNFRHSKGSLV
ncbi:hypothetical protein L3X38_026607 [Prunus dulcis]|uniref:Uncharacterized protein n=1 Tax=Prunus dulcis TaxID=3755 RepID=A0AAD4VNM7_PRUDU|nr:hypothetical protein L3X38_026607 [Prunus dulcis]